MNYPSAKANGFPTQSTANSAKNLSYVKAVGLDGGSRRSPVLIELESQNIHILESFQNHYYINGHSSHPLKQAGFLPAPKINTSTIFAHIDPNIYEITNQINLFYFEIVLKYTNHCRSQFFSGYFYFSKRKSINSLGFIKNNFFSIIIYIYCM